MTVKKYFESTGIDDAEILCQWFAGDKLQLGTFCLDSVEVEEDISTE